MHKRILNLALSDRESCFLWGPRQTGKSTLLRQLYGGAKTYDLLLSREYQRLVRNPGLLREECLADDRLRQKNALPVIIDEVQKVPALLDEVHWMIENAGIRFVLCGSSARKVKRGQANLLGGRAVRYELHPLVYTEVIGFSLTDALNRGLLPRHYRAPHANRLMQSYVGDYLREEIAAEALTRNIPAFGRFLEVAAMSNGELVNYVNIASECGVSAPTVKEYFRHRSRLHPGGSRGGRRGEIKPNGHRPAPERAPGLQGRLSGTAFDRHLIGPQTPQNLRRHRHPAVGRVFKTAVGQ